MGNAFLWKRGNYTKVFKADRSKLFASNEKQTENYCLTCFTQTCQLCVPTIVEVSFMKNIFWCDCCSLLIFVAKKARKGTELQFLCTQGTLQGGRVEDHRLMFTIGTSTYHNYIFKQYSSYIHKTDYMMSLTLYTLTSVCIFSILFSLHLLMCWKGEFVEQSRGSSVDYHFLYSHDLIKCLI